MTLHTALRPGRVLPAAIVAAAVTMALAGPARAAGPAPAPAPPARPGPPPALIQASLAPGRPPLRSGSGAALVVTV